MEWLGLIAQQVTGLEESTFRIAVIIMAYFVVRELRGMRRSMNNLNLVLTKIVGRLNSHERRISHLERIK